MSAQYDGRREMNSTISKFRTWRSLLPVFTAFILLGLTKVVGAEGNSTSLKMTDSFKIPLLGYIEQPEYFSLIKLRLIICQVLRTMKTIESLLEPWWLSSAPVLSKVVSLYRHKIFICHLTFWKLWQIKHFPMKGVELSASFFRLKGNLSFCS